MASLSSGISVDSDGKSYKWAPVAVNHMQLQVTLYCLYTSEVEKYYII